ncbi:pantetheine-phosphate adenylyltransferase [Alginatibacterium sediminis]|uniref:Phosphopantetheine adenylyltransferase n=1 Tax=Alginatibacterium sediminis TaxID=2164068 RepID=A0A420ENH3_9ALTE|nr:pantetheine-phosphate adenylyltransferase [Alginatibacterium sediminis]RKF22144.1 pantetheine-phosphate adenylyltransferase [Alginatibacterium sediminis]
MKKVLYPGTFDPITNGHMDIIRRGALLFDKLIIAIAASPSKKPLFDLEQRVQLAKLATADFDNVEVLGFSGLLVDLHQNQQAAAVLRGVRSVSDFDYELQLANLNRKLKPEFETIYLSPIEETACISSTFVREISLHGGDIQNLVPNCVFEAMAKQKLN